MRAGRAPERGSCSRGRAPGSRPGLAVERGAVAAAQPQRMACTGRVGVRGIPVARARVAAHPATGRAAASARARPRRRLDGQRNDGPPRATRRLRSLGRLRMPRLVLRRHGSVPAANGERRRLRRPALPRVTRSDPRPAPPARGMGPADNALADAALGLGHPWCEDHNAPTATGVSPFGFNARDGARVTTNDAYLEPARERANLRVIGGANVERVLIEAGRAVGVRVRVGNDRIDVRAGGVVLCAGTIHSPAILLRSGIGPDGPVVRLPVGHGMQEHPLALFWLFPRPEARPDVDARQANCLVRYSSQLEDAGSDDMMIASVNQTPALSDDTRSHLAADAEGGTWGGAGGGQASCGPGLLCVWANQQRGRGWLGLTSPDPDVGPRIEQQLLDDPGDLRRMRDGVKRCLQLVATGAFDAAFHHIGIDPTG